MPLTILRGMKAQAPGPVTEKVVQVSFTLLKTTILAHKKKGGYQPPF